MVREKPRKTTEKRRKNIAVAQVRNSAKKTQAQFARCIGLETPTFQQIEDGRRVLTPEEAERIMAYCGADPKSLIEGKRAKTVSGRPYSRNSFELWNKQDVNPSAVDIAAQRAALMADALVRAAYADAGGNRKDPPRYRFVTMQLSRYLFELAKGNLIETGFKQELHKVVLHEWTGELLPRQIKKLLGVKGEGKGVLGYEPFSAGKVSKHGALPVKVIYRPIPYPFAGGSRIINKGRGQIDGLAMNLITVHVQLPWHGKPTTTLQAIALKSFVAGSKWSRGSDYALPRSTGTAKLFAALGVI